MKVNFELYKSEDYSELKNMILGLYSEDPPSVPMAEEKILGTVKELTNHQDKGQIILFRVNNETAGYGIIIFFWSNEYGGNIIYVDELFVKEEWRSKKIGTSFFNYLLENFRDKATALKLEVTPRNVRARKYYEHMGFKETRNIHLLKSI
ncbi:MAG: GNAT family N-acetyltransferase [Candidatus Eremiobacterota bacterium]